MVATINAAIAVLEEEGGFMATKADRYKEFGPKQGSKAKTKKPGKMEK